MAENTYMIFHPTRLAFFKWYLIAIVVIIVGVIVSLAAFKVITLVQIPETYNFYVLIIPFLGIIFIIIAETLRRLDTYAITSNRVVEKIGIINIKEDSIYWEKIANYSLKQGLLDRIFKVGTIELWSMGGGGERKEEAEVVIKKAPNIKKIRYLLDRLIQKR